MSADNENAYIGSDRDTLRNETQPSLDQPSGSNVSGPTNYAFGSAHSTGFCMAFCDGHTQFIPFSINLTVHQELCNRHDGSAVDLSGH